MSAGLAMRVAALLALALFGAAHWASQVEPRGTAALGAMVAAGIAVGLVARGAPALAPALRLALLASLALVTVVFDLVVAGVSVALLAPESWGALVSGLGQGLESIPGLRVPYRGEDEWTRAIVLCGGGLLVALAAVLALAPVPSPRRTAGAAIALGVLYGVPIVEQDPASPYLDGAVFALLLAALVSVDRLRRAEVPLAVALIMAASLGGLVLAPRVDADRPWLDYARLAERFDENRTARFTWNHRYDALDWRRDGRELLRIRTSRAQYWKAVALEDFDGRVWRRARSYNPIDDDTEFTPGRPRWRQSMRVTLRGLATEEYIGAGTTAAIERTRRVVVASTPGTFVTGLRPLRRGDTYTARFYAPAPEPAELRDAGIGYPEFTRRQRTMEIPAAPGHDAPTLRFASWGSVEPSFAYYPNGAYVLDGARLVRRSPYSRMYARAQAMRAASRTPYDYALRVMREVRAGATYTERPPAAGFPLDAFLFKDKRGYCQQFSGAMALLLRMGGVPARVAAGFTPGSRDSGRGEFVVRDVDAHSWVEVYFPGYGWVTFDPTPPEAPARSQLSGVGTPDAADSGAPLPGAAGDRASDPTAGGAGGERVLNPLAALALALAALGLLLGAAVLRRRLAARRAAADAGLPSAVAELRRALRRSGRTVAVDLTLARIERLVGGDRDARAYVAALRMARFGAGAPPPSPRQRRALRGALAAGLGVRGRLRALWALPLRRFELLELVRSALRQGGGERLSRRDTLP